MTRLLLVDENAKTLNVLSTLLRTEGYKVIPLFALEKTLGFIKSQQFDLMILDICQNTDKGIEVLRTVRAERSDLPIVVITDQKSGDRDENISSLKFVEWVEKPFKVDQFMSKVQAVIDGQRGAQAGVIMTTQPLIEMVDGVEGIIARSSAMRNVCETIKRVGPTEIAILVQGEQGTDKEQVARAIHASSQRKDQQFMLFDCAEIPDESAINLKLFGCQKKTSDSSSADLEGLFETTGEGILFLDKVEALPLSTQEKIYHVFLRKKIKREGGQEDIPVNVRVIAGTSENLAGKVQAGEFHKGLYQTLSVMPIQLKPLRECKKDIAPIVDKLLRKESGPEKTPMACDRETISIMEHYPWPGNTEELKQAIHHAVNHASGNIITKQDLPANIVSAGTA